MSLTPEQVLAAQPRQDILALADSLLVILEAKIAAGYVPTNEEHEIIDRARRDLPALHPNH
jgi:hypothetical protein